MTSLGRSNSNGMDTDKPGRRVPLVLADAIMVLPALLVVVGLLPAVIVRAARSKREGSA